MRFSASRRTPAMVQSFHHVLLAALVTLVLALFTPRVYADFTEAHYTATYLFLSGFPYSFSSLQSDWSGGAFCSWRGVTCDNSSNVTYISVNLAGQSLSGTLPSILNEVTDRNLPVHSVDLSNNHGITGTFKADWAALRSIVYLDLSSTNLHGTIPDSWNSMVHLVTLNLSHTYACKGLPNWNISTLRSVDLSHSRLKGVLASSWGSMTNLTDVDISGNSFCGCVPSSWSSSTVLAKAAAAIGGNLVTPTCESSNKCKSSNYMCPSAAAEPISVVVVAGLLLSLFVAIAVM